MGVTRGVAVSAGDYLGIWMGTTFKVDFTYTSDAGDPVEYSPNGYYLAMPTAGATLSTPGTNQLRDYSINVRFSPVPIPPAALLFGTAVLGLALVARRRKTQLVA